MRREWAAFIKNRRWEEFEKLAKTEPDQILCDTVAELEKGFTEKADRKALKKVLWILEKEGFTPNEVEETASEAPAPALLTAAFMLSADSRGDTPITYGSEDKGRVRWLTAYVNETKGITRASEDSMSSAEGHARLQLLRSSEARPYLSAEIDPAYALWRFKRALSKNRPGSTPPAIAYWRSVIEKATELPHPSKELKATKTKASERSEEILLMDPTLAWRLELGAATPILEQMYEAQQANAEASEDEKKAATKKAGEEARKMVITPEIVADHAMRLRDLAWLMHLKGDEQAGKVLSAAEELEKKGADSEYAKGLVDKTVVIYVESMKNAEQS